MIILIGWVCWQKFPSCYSFIIMCQSCGSPQECLSCGFWICIIGPVMWVSVTPQVFN
jgi:hypothetical protein